MPSTSAFIFSARAGSSTRSAGFSLAVSTTAAVKAITAVKESLQVAIAECQQPGAHPSLIALLAFTLQIHFTLCGDDGFDIVGLPQGLHPHIIVHTQQNVFQVGAGKTVLGNFADAAVLHVAAEQGGQHRADLALTLAAIALNDHHALSLVAGDQAVADIFLQSGNVLRVKKPIQKSQPAGRRGRIGIIGHRQAATHDIRFSLRKGAIQKQRAVCQMNAVSLRREIPLPAPASFISSTILLILRGIVRTAQHFSSSKISPRSGSSSVTRPSGVKKAPVCVDDFVSAEKIITKQGFIDTLAVKPDGLVGLTRLLVLRHGAAPPIPDV